MNIRFETTGCRLNQIETESAANEFVNSGFNVILSPLTAKSPVDDDCLLCVINTCAVTQKAEQKDRRIIRLVLEKCPSAVVIVTGCYAQLSAEFLNSMDLRIAVLKGQLKSRIVEVPDLLKKELENGVYKPADFAQKLRAGLFSSPVKLQFTSENAFRLATDSFLAHSRSSIKIQDGCNCKCSYCTINIARGRSVSLAAEEVVRRVQALEKAGQAEVVFTSVNIGQYVSSWEGKAINFTGLLKLCLDATKNIAFRISSLYPEVVNEEFCSVIKDPRVRPHFHISVQSGSNLVLGAMKRNYLAEDVINAARMLKQAKANPFLAADIITGFPGESDEDFEQTMSLCRACDFAWVHVFPFSPRPGTAAYDMKPKVPQSVSGERAKKLSEWAFENKIKYINSFKGKTVSAVLETVKKPSVFQGDSGKSVFHAVTENFLHCEIISSEKAFKPGSAIQLKILGPIGLGAKKGGEVDCLADFV